MNQQPVKPEYMDAIWLTFIQQMPCLIICVLLLDGGGTLRVCLIATLGFWLFAMLCLIRSQRDHEVFGLWFLRWGFFPLFGILFCINYQILPLVRR